MRKLIYKAVTKWLRILHRDLGYFFVGITLVYGISGIILVHKKKGVDPAYNTIVVKKQISKNLSPNNFSQAFVEELPEYKLNKVVAENEILKVFLDGGVGQYHVNSGTLEFEVYKRKPLVYFINKLHFNQIKGWTFFADFFAVSLIFMAISGLFIVPGKNGFKRRGVWFMAAGIILVVVFTFFM